MSDGSGDNDGAAQMWREVVDSSVECELCNEPYAHSDAHVPRLLWCGHTFCEACLDNWSFMNATQDASSRDGPIHGHGPGQQTMMECPTCRRPTAFNPVDGARGLPKNFELLRVRQEIENQTQQQLEKLQSAWATQVLEKEQLAREAEQQAQRAQRESVEASQRATLLVKQVEINEQEKKRAQQLAEEARLRAVKASQQAEELQAETELLKQRLQQEALHLQRVKNDATSAHAHAAELHNKAEELQQQVEHVRAQLSLRSGRHDPSKLMVLVVEPTTVGSWLLPYTRYAVISIASDVERKIDPYTAAQTWTMMHQVAEPSSSVKVYRRYSDFVWLHHELRTKFPFELVPCMPGKQLFFNKDREFVGERMRLLQAFLRQVLRHPMLAVTEETRAFLLSTTEELEQLRKLSRLQSDEDDDDFIEFEDAREAAHPNGHSKTTPPKAPVATNAASSSASSSSWAWGAMSALTTGAAKLVSHTGNALTSSISSVTAASTGTTSDDTAEKNLSSSLLAMGDAPDGNSAVTVAAWQCAEKRKKYLDILQAHQVVAQKGNALSRVERQYSHHLHRLCEWVHRLDTLDKTYSTKKRERMAMSSMECSTYTPQQVEEDPLSCLESWSFESRASETLSALSLASQNDAECMEYALLEASRMQTLHLGAIEDAFSRLRVKEDTLKRAAAALSAGADPIESPALSSAALASKREELQQHRAALMDKVNAIDPARAHFVLETLQSNIAGMHKLAQARRKLHEASLQQLRLAARTAPM